MEVITIIKTNGGFLIGKIKQIQGRVFEKLLTDHGIHQFNNAQGRILYVLWNHDHIAISELSADTGLAKTTLTSMLDRMEASGYIQRVLDPEDRRMVRINLTDAAKNLKEVYEEVSQQMSEIFYEGFTEAEINAFEGVLERVLHNLTEKENQK